MRSESRRQRGQASLPLELPRASEPARVVGPRRVHEGPPTHLVTDDALASYGWPAGTVLTLDPRRRPQRGDLAVVREGSRLLVGVFERQLGRAVLRADTGVTWLGPSVRHLGVATQVDAPLAGMPESPSA